METWYERGIREGLETLESSPDIFKDILERNALLPSQEAYDFYRGLKEAQRQYASLNDHEL